MSFVRSARRSVPTIALAALLLVGCGAPTGSPGPSGSTTASASGSASPSTKSWPPSSYLSASPTASPTATPSPTPAPTTRPTPVPTKVATPVPNPPTATPGPGTGPASLATVLVTGGLSSPIGVTNAGDGSGRLFVIQRSGQVRVINPDGTLRSAPFVDISGRVVSGGEQGLLGLAFHPNFESNGRLFVDYTRSDGSGHWEDVVSELTASADHSTANPASERILLVVPDPYTNHNGGQLAFGPNGLLYIAMGDGGSGGDPAGNAQNKQALLGKILRIDVNGAHAAGKEYAIPNTNPYAPGGVSPGAGLPEIWAYGLRNPWRFSFDRGTGDLYIGDVGQNSWEEIDRQPAGSKGGENYGWDAFEGRHCFENCSGVTYIPPIAEYGHGSGCSVTGGYVYRGPSQVALKGFYVFADYCSGTIWTVPAGAGNKTPKVVDPSGLSIASFGESEAGELYLVDLGGGGLYQVVIGT